MFGVKLKRGEVIVEDAKQVIESSVKN